MSKCRTHGQEIAIQEGKTIKIPELKIEVETEIHDKGKKLSGINIPKGIGEFQTQPSDDDIMEMFEDMFGDM